ncbi:hypothetical protein GRI58_12450 [Porphyrobacter algicida]|uniref:Uncharacterized protein n=1 Tax=Qipengyuania algicida TaxID=1836209 RepID=A0A845AJN7_9SPHN|nr:hypothetical protein [Qipengyuania algicida]MXP29627.1 hypothetical protein [Qipengyuania algicida]
MIALIGQAVFRMTKEHQREIQRKLRELQHAERTGQVGRDKRAMLTGHQLDVRLPPISRRSSNSVASPIAVSRSHQRQLFTFWPETGISDADAIADINKSRFLR